MVYIYSGESESLEEKEDAGELDGDVLEMRYAVY
jgi:hypothetical protein